MDCTPRRRNRTVDGNRDMGMIIDYSPNISSQGPRRNGHEGAARHGRENNVKSNQRLYGGCPPCRSCTVQPRYRELWRLRTDQVGLVFGAESLDNVLRFCVGLDEEAQASPAFVEGLCSFAETTSETVSGAFAVSGGPRAREFFGACWTNVRQYNPLVTS